MPASTDYGTHITVLVVGMVLSFLTSLLTVVMAWLKDARDRRWKAEDSLKQQDIAVKTEILLTEVEKTKQQGAVIHDLVNSNMTAAMQDQLIALQGQQVLMQRVLLDSGVAQTKEEEATIFSLEAKIKDLGEAVRLRNMQQETAKLKVEVDKAKVDLIAAHPPEPLIPPVILKSLL